MVWGEDRDLPLGAYFEVCKAKNLIYHLQSLHFCSPTMTDVRTDVEEVQPRSFHAKPPLTDYLTGEGVKPDHSGHPYTLDTFNQIHATE